MITYNGYKPGEARVVSHRPRRSDRGHTAVKVEIRRRGSTFAFGYAVTCQCGAGFTSRVDAGRALRSHDEHVTKETHRT